MKSPSFSIIAPDFEGSVSTYRRTRFIESVLHQSYPEWELLLIHDGPRSVDVKTTDPRIMCFSTPNRYNDWGHTLRDIGIRKARGEYIWIINPDNLIYKNALAILFAYSLQKNSSFPFKTKSGDIVTHQENNGVLICAILMMGAKHILFGGGHHRFKGQEEKHQMVLPGWPPVKYRIDAMSAVIKRNIWLAKGGWSLKHEESDGDLIQQIAEEFGYRIIPEVLGEHW